VIDLELSSLQLNTVMVVVLLRLIICSVRPKLTLSSLRALTVPPSSVASLWRWRCLSWSSSRCWMLWTGASSSSCLDHYRWCLLL